METLKQILNKEISNYENLTDFKKWAGDKTIEEVVFSIDRGDLFLGLGYKLGLDIKILTLAKARCAETMLDFMEYKRSKDAVQSSIDFAHGLISAWDLHVISYDALDIVSIYGQHIHGIASINHTAAYIAYGAASASGSSIVLGNKCINQKDTSNICREIIGQAIIDKVNEMLTPKPRGLCIYKYYG